ncbi:ABC transporter substrate-binding protein [Desulfofundulus thermosubterraneus]|uniref:Branched-chain amino acid transport system substrate-binding protein n=1 Tax=Desulfofundulus thermosubterraneus DSM 16057 TaxID=1121432 RepID=A0A1M6H8A1_9FIRM|nr:ABC transporter substrate-binding protein [Desulfofundulus thermosubterraneus]SHJ18478.1 branched-chain amino acid transport system substrate-binding protein [Desulfofundulus thermosubterraneus DSM 16057]
MDEKIKKWLLLVSLFTIALLMTACGSGSGNGQSSAAKTIKIGFFAPETGPEAADGTSAYNAAKLAVEQINAGGGINGAKLELVNYDDQLDTKQAVSIAQKLTTKDGVVAVVSGSYSGPTRAAAPIFQQAKMPMISAYAVHPAIPRTGDYIFQLGLSGIVEGAAAAEVAKNELHAKNVAILAIDNDFGHTLVQGFTQRAGQIGLKVQEPNWFHFGDTEFTPVLTKIKNSGADVLFMPAYAAEGSQIIRRIHDMGLKIQPLGTEGLDSTTQFLEVAGKDANGLVIVTDFNRDSKEQVVKDFIKAYKERYGHEPDMVAASTYDAFYVLAEAVRKSGTTPDKIREGIASIKDFQAVSKINGFDGIRQANKPVAVQQVKDGTFRYFGEITDPTIITPPVN